MPPAKRLQIPKRLEYIDRVADVVKQNVVEFLVLARKLEELFRVRENHCKIERWISFLSDLVLSRRKYLSPSLYAGAHRGQEHRRCRNELIALSFGARRGIEEAG